MKKELEYIGKKIVGSHMMLAENVEKLVDEKYTEKMNYAGMPEETLREYRAELISYFGEALYGDREEIAEKVAEWGRKAGEFAVHYNTSLTDALRAVSLYRSVIWDVFTEELEEQQFAAITMLDVSKIIDPLLDKVSNVIGKVYEEYNNRLMTVAYTALEELSVPVVPVAEGIAVIPLVGEIDTHRAQLITEISLKAGTSLDLDYIILDVSGVKIIDTMVSNQIFQILKALGLIGVETIITGIRPEVAQTIGNLGLNYNEVRTLGTMQQALEYLGFKRVDC